MCISDGEEGKGGDAGLFSVLLIEKARDSELNTVNFFAQMTLQSVAQSFHGKISGFKTCCCASCISLCDFILALWNLIIRFFGLLSIKHFL